MKYILSILAVTFMLAGCTSSKKQMLVLQSQVDSLKTELSNVYKPGFGEFMGNIQSHHIKLWYAGEYQNWMLADFEIHEIMETVKDIQKYEPEREESKEIGMIWPALDSVNTSIVKKDPDAFRKNYERLTNTCNACHQAVHFSFNFIQIPDSQPFSNQDFKVRKP